MAVKSLLYFSSSSKADVTAIADEAASMQNCLGKGHGERNYPEEAPWGRSWREAGHCRRDKGRTKKNQTFWDMRVGWQEVFIFATRADKSSSWHCLTPSKTASTICKILFCKLRASIMPFQLKEGSMLAHMTACVQPSYNNCQLCLTVWESQPCVCLTQLLFRHAGCGHRQGKKRAALHRA